MLTQKRLLEIVHYDPETGVLTWREPGRKRIVGERVGSSKGAGWYRQVTLNGYNYLEHRLIWFYVKGRWPKEVDHKNRNKADNRWVNLHEVTHKQNGENNQVRKNNTSGVPGVSFDKRGWWASYIKSNRKKIHFGCFKDFTEAVAARKQGEADHFTNAYGPEQAT